MAITITHNPNSVVRARQRLVYNATSDNVSETGFKYVVQVYEGATEIIKLYIPPNPSDVLVWDLSEIAKTLVKPAVESATTGGGLVVHASHLLGGRAFKRSNGDTIKGVGTALQVRIGEVYEVSGTLTEDLDLDNHDIFIIDGWRTIRQGFDADISDELGFGNKNWATDREPSAAPDGIEVTASFGVIYIPVHETDWGTIGIYNNSTYTPGFNSYFTDVRFQIYDADNTELDSYDITLDSSTGSGIGTSSTASEKMVFLLAYPKNVNHATHPVAVALASPANYADWAYYVWTPLYSTIEAGYKVVMYKETKPCKHLRYTVAFQNSFGMYDYLAMVGRAESSMSRETKEYDKLLGTYDETTYGFNTYDRETAYYTVEASKEIKLSANLEVHEFVLLEKLLASKEIQLLKETTDGSCEMIPVTLMTNSVQIHDELESKIKTVELTFKVAQRYAFT